MRESSPETKLLRVLATLVWIDGTVDESEQTFLRGLAVEYGLDQAETAEIEKLLDTPLSYQDFETSLRVFREGAGAADRAQLLARAERLVDADAERAPLELKALQVLRESLQEPEGQASGVAGRFRGLLGGGSLGELARELMGRSPARGEAAFPGGPDFDRRRGYATLFGALLYRVIYADKVVEPQEAAQLRAVLANELGFEAGEVDYALRAIQQRVAQDLDRQRLCAEFNRISSMDERLSLLRAMLEMAMADGSIAPDEEKEVRLIANYLWIEVQDFVQVRRSVLDR